MDVAFYGAAGEVTGSCYLLQARDKRILIDCGAFQGSDDSGPADHEVFGFDPASVDYVLLTHAHLDHCGRLPHLAKAGFRGEIVATSATRDLTRLVLLDAAHLQEDEAKRNARREQRRGGNASSPAFDELDVFDVMDRFGRPATYDQRIELCDGIAVTFGNAGHILGSAWALLEVEERGTRQRLLFSGDLGTGESPILDPPTPAPRADIVVMESTYGDRLHKRLEPSLAELRDAILDTLDRGGNVIIPTFALERAQEVLYHLRALVEQGALPKSLSVYLDSPMAISATAIFRRRAEFIGDAVRAMLASGDDPFDLPGLRLTRESAESSAINQIRSGAVILAGSGMATGGRVLHHLKHNLWRPESSIVFVGYAADGTLARRIIDGQRVVRIFGEEIRVAAHIYTIGGFSAHADRQDLLNWYESSGSPTTTFLVHGEEGPRQSLAERLETQGNHVELPALRTTWSL